MMNKTELKSPEAVILKLYDLGIQACEDGNREGVKQALRKLIEALNFEYGKIAYSFFDLYDFALSAVNEGNLDEALYILRGLRSAWDEHVIARDGILETVS